MNKPLFHSPFFENKHVYSFSVSKLSHFEFCPIRSKIEIINKGGKFSTISKAIIKGIHMHELYTLPNRSFYRLLVRSRLSRYAKKIYQHFVWSKQINCKDYIIQVTGSYDDLRVLNKKYTVLIEVKTTDKKYMWSHEIKAAVKQLQLYMWLLKEYLEKIKYPLWERGYVEVYSQKTGKLLRSIPVKYDSEIEEWVKYVVRTYQGLEPIRIPDIKLCKMCPPNIKTQCSWYEIRKRK